MGRTNDDAPTPTDDRQPATQADLDAFLEPQAPEEIPPLVGGQPVSPDPGATEPRTTARPTSPVEDDRLTKALQTIEGLQRTVADLQGRPVREVVVDRSPTRDTMPEMLEVFPGRFIPKDPNSRAIKLRGEDLVRMGWNEDPAAALNALGNALLMHIAEVIPQLTIGQLEEHGRAYSAGQGRKDAFFNEFADLREFGDLADIVERQTMQEVPIQGMSQGEWNREVGGRVRQRIAAMRGISMDQYMASLGARPNGAAARPRAVTGPTAGGSARRAPVNDQQREMDDLLEGRLGG